MPNGETGGILGMMYAKGTAWTAPPGSRGYPMVIAHRGGSDLAPENTLAAFRNALDLGADAIELDVRLTRDRRLAVFHDRRLERTTMGSGVIGTFTMEELKRLDAGSWYGPEYAGEGVPSLEEVFEALPEDFPIYVEMKARGPNGLSLASAVAGVIRRYDRWESSMVASFNPISIIYLRLAHSRIVRGYIWSHKHVLPLRARWLEPLAAPRWLAPDRGTLTPRLLARAHAQGKLVAAWDMDGGPDMDSMSRMVLDAVITDRPDIMVAQRHGLVRERSRGPGGQPLR